MERIVSSLRNIPGIDSRFTRLVNPNQQTTVVQSTAEAHGVLKRHIERSTLIHL